MMTADPKDFMKWDVKDLDRMAQAELHQTGLNLLRSDYVVYVKYHEKKKPVIEYTRRYIGNGVWSVEIRIPGYLGDCPERTLRLFLKKTLYRIYRQDFEYDSNESEAVGYWLTHNRHRWTDDGKN